MCFAFTVWGSTVIYQMLYESVCVFQVYIGKNMLQISTYFDVKQSYSQSHTEVTVKQKWYYRLYRFHFHYSH